MYGVYMKYILNTGYDKRKNLKSSLNFKILNILHQMYFVTETNFHLLFPL